MTSDTSLRPVSPLRARMIEDMTVRGFNEHTRRDYVRHVRAFAAFIGRSPDTATAEDLRLFQLHQTQSGMQPPSINSAVSALRFFFTVTLDRPDLSRRLTVVPQPRRIPAVLSAEEVTLLLRAATAPKYRAAFAPAYGAGLRVRVKRGLRRPLAEWDVLLKDQHDGYISWSQFERNQQVIADNATGKGSAAVRGAVRRGELLLARLLRCGHCGRKLYVGYGGKAGRYYCQGALVNHGTERCISFGGLRVDHAVGGEVLRVLKPARHQCRSDGAQGSDERDISRPEATRSGAAAGALLGQHRRQARCACCDPESVAGRVT
jgi:Phage integrase, N-terminal SAM-like domain